MSKLVGNDYYVSWQGIVLTDANPSMLRDFDPGFEVEYVEGTASGDEIRMHIKNGLVTIDPTATVLIPTGTAGTAAVAAMRAGQAGTLFWSRGTASGTRRWGVVAEVAKGIDSGEAITYDDIVSADVIWKVTSGQLVYDGRDAADAWS